MFDSKFDAFFLSDEGEKKIIPKKGLHRKFNTLISGLLFLGKDFSHFRRLLCSGNLLHLWAQG